MSKMEDFFDSPCFFKFVDGKLPILAAVQECRFKVLEVLLKWGANPVHLTINQGDTPIHAALSIALERDKG